MDTGGRPWPSTSPSARRRRAPRSSPPPRRRGGRAARRRRAADRRAQDRRAARPMRRTRPCRCAGCAARHVQYMFPMPQFIYTMKGLGKVYPRDAKVLEDIWLSFLPGAKIGVLGLNGAGKSSILRIMAGEDHEFLGEAFAAGGISVGFLPQEPRLDATKTVLGNVEEGVADIRALLTRYDETNAKLGED